MSREPLDSRIQLQPTAILGSSELAEPVQQLRAKSLPLRLLIRHEVVHITKPSPSQTMQHPETRDGGKPMRAPAAKR